jgi:hypothetical protein
MITHLINNALAQAIKGQDAYTGKNISQTGH